MRKCRVSWWCQLSDTPRREKRRASDALLHTRCHRAVMRQWWGIKGNAPVGLARHRGALPFVPYLCYTAFRQKNAVGFRLCSFAQWTGVMSLAVQWNGTAMDITPVLTNNESTMAACAIVLLPWQTWSVTECLSYQNIGRKEVDMERTGREWMPTSFRHKAIDTACRIPEQ